MPPLAHARRLCAALALAALAAPAASAGVSVWVPEPQDPSVSFDLRA
jgi:hypothetical protein